MSKKIVVENCAECPNVEQKPPRMANWSTDPIFQCLADTGRAINGKDKDILPHSEIPDWCPLDDN